MLLEKLFPFLPTQGIEIIIYVVAALGAVLITYAVFLETERYQDIIFFIGSACLFVYALYIGNRVFMVATAGLGLASMVEFVEILIGLHKEESGKYELKRIKNLNK